MVLGLILALFQRFWALIWSIFANILGVLGLDLAPFWTYSGGLWP